MPESLEDLLKEAGYVVAHGLIAVAFLLIFKTIAAGRAGELVPAVRSVASAV